VGNTRDTVIGKGTFLIFSQPTPPFLNITLGCHDYFDAPSSATFYWKCGIVTGILGR
jgi:hypothetical protein